SYLFLLIINLPVLALFEERTFRKRNEKTAMWILLSIGFGLVHVLVGVPISVGLSLSFFGFVLGWYYRINFRSIKHLSNKDKIEECCLRCAALHAVYNGIVCSVLLGYLLIL
ncbi:MAG: hypothetical protein ACRCXZ_08765, partial [Patescibacteria group bacterium]